MNEPNRDLSKPSGPWYRPVLAWLIYVSLGVSGLLYLSERRRWFPFNEHKGWTVLIIWGWVVTMKILLVST